MKNNDILRRIRYIFDFGDEKMAAVFRLVDSSVTREQVGNWLKKEDDPGFEECEDLVLATFLDGLISEKRGGKEGTAPKLEKRLTNNIILRKLKIALDLKDHDILDLLALAQFPLGKAELSAFFRKPEHRHYRPCRDQILRHILKGLQLRYRPPSAISGFQWKRDQIGD